MIQMREKTCPVIVLTTDEMLFRNYLFAILHYFDLFLNESKTLKHRLQLITFKFILVIVANYPKTNNEAPNHFDIICFEIK